MLLYVAASKRAVSAVMVVERKEEGKEQPIHHIVYYISEALTESKQRYPHYEKLVYSVFRAQRRLAPYFHEHPVKVVASTPLADIGAPPLHHRTRGAHKSPMRDGEESTESLTHRIPVPVHYKLPHGWHVSYGGFAVPPPPPPGPQTRALARERRAEMTPEERNLPENALESPSWAWRFEHECSVKLARTDNLSGGRFNNVGRRSWWYGRSVDDTLRQYGFRPRVHGQRELLYFPQEATMAPAPTL
ncbi:hypothetical protein QYE76_051405 [Lolium multiflorum]|uniref:Reverse transcriptase RNase H-like domain-containing protein n=1 Tax=Lolium multiflorum TaxID=4521 RepID=A0AAD8STE0_LOLMU|nr:hypothetical protein QYE76_051405 [Lolium multiflorum]